MKSNREEYRGFISASTEKAKSKEEERQLSSFELELLANPSDKDGKQKASVDRMFISGHVDAPIERLAGISKGAHQDRIRELVTEYRKTLDEPKSLERTAKQKVIGKEVGKIIDEALSEQ